MGKNYLDSEGLGLYDKLIKEYIDQANSLDNSAISEEKERAEKAEQTLKDQIQALIDGQVKTNADAIDSINDALDVLNGDAETEGSVAKQVNDAVAALIDSAPETFDTLREIAEWIAEDENGTSKIIDRVSDNEEEIKNLKNYIDAQDQFYYNSIDSIGLDKVMILFKEEVKVSSEDSLAAALENLGENEYLTLEENSEIAENLVIDKPVYIDAKGATFTGTVTVDGTKDITIENAVFKNPVVVQ